MTAVVGIINKRGVAIAADSAVTVNGPQGRKVYNSANKIFTLSKYHPIGVSIYNNAVRMGIPWETIIKEFRSYLEKQEYDSVSEYKDEFFNWLHDKEYFQSDNDNSHLQNDFVSFLDVVVKESYKRKNSTDIVEADVIEFIQFYEASILPKHKRIEVFAELDQVALKDKLRALIPSIIMIAKDVFDVELSQEISGDILINGYTSYLLHDQFLQYTGIIFTGFGKNEMFPQLIPVNVSIVIEGQLRYNLDSNKKASVTQNEQSFIRPFAQTDVIDTVLQGISPELYKMTHEVFGGFLSNFVEEIKAIDGIPKDLVGKLNSLNINNYVEGYSNEINKVVSIKYVQPLMNAVSQLSKEDLAEMAESLIYLTYLKRRFSMAEESVGGPVDIAVITKGDGFIWIKRKHYFDPKLNQYFFQKYL